MTRPSTLLSGRGHVLLGLIIFGLLLFVPAWADRGLIFLVGVMLTYIVLALSYNTIFGLGGMISFGHAAYFAIGAYASGMALRHIPDVSLLVALAMGAVFGGVLALLIGGVALRRASGTYFAILTLAFAELLHILIAKTSWLGREDGLTGIVQPVMTIPGAGSVDLSQGNNIYYAVLIFTALFVMGAWVIWHSRFGRVLAAIRQEPDRAAFLGVNVHRTRLMAFVLSGMGAGLAGAMYAPLAQILTPGIAHWSFSALPILFCLLGGAAMFWGPVLGVVAFVSLEHFTRNIIGLSEIVTGATLLFVVLAFPGGISGGIRKVFELLRSRNVIESKSVEVGQ
ncbi:branched-chain amino acid ABC transporter permease [bacterium SGD-2]|nr:branched-chain amino acid ABC transporter permease [bacterium SGD-2]